MQHRKRAAMAAAVTTWLFAGAAALAQTGSAPAVGPAVGVRAIIHSVADLDKTVKFYRDGLGMEPLGAGGKPLSSLPSPNPLNEDLSKFTNTHGAKFRNAIFVIPGTKLQLELTEFSGIPLKHTMPHMQDPGATTLILMTRDLDATLAKVKENGGTVLSLGGHPMKVGGENSKSRSVFVRDPDGFLLELAHIEPPLPTATGSGNITGARIGLTIENTDQSMKFYHDVLGFETKPGASFSTDKSIASLIDARGAEWRINSAQVPGSPVEWEMIEFKDIARKPFKLNVPGRGFAGRFRDCQRCALRRGSSEGWWRIDGNQGRPAHPAQQNTAGVRARSERSSNRADAGTPPLAGITYPS